MLDKPKPGRTSADAFSVFGEAKALAADIARRERLSEDAVFADAMHVAVAIALETDDMPYTKANVAWMFDRVSPEEVREVLLFRLHAPDEYETLPMAGKMERLNAAELHAATALAEKLTRAEIDALFFSDIVGRA